MMKKVLIALDYDPTAQKIAEEGFLMATQMSAEVILVHVVSDPVYYAALDYSPIMGFTGYEGAGAMQMEMIDGLKKASEHFLAKTKHHLGDASIKTLVTEGDFASAILEAAKDVQADIIVMGSHSKKWLEKIVMGSVTESVLRQTTVPLFIIPTKKQNSI
jgi:nucleotide-binding universal stress UspA family protein